MKTVGIIASPSAGKDVRRLVGHAGSTGDVDKIAVIRRAALGVVESGIDRIMFLDDTKHLIQRALEAIPQGDVVMEPIEQAVMGNGRDSEKAAAALEKAEAGAVIVFGGDGTNRDVAKGWANVPLVPLSVGTNNVFPFHMESTIGGIAAGLVARGEIPLQEVAERTKIIKVNLANGETDLALVDLVLVEGDFIGSRAIWDVSNLKEGVFAIAESSTVGLSSIAATLKTIRREDDVGIHVEMGTGTQTVRAPIAPGTYETVHIRSHRELALGETITINGPGVLAFDGERDYVLSEDQKVTAFITREGPWVINTQRAMDLANMNNYFVTST
ncbi:MAG: NAD(+)/NADH kinase [Acidimicrobiales bacterium]|nr:NAD(+)/NADH kinase [Acidimicrobiales bacterium]